MKSRIQHPASSLQHPVPTTRVKVRIRGPRCLTLTVPTGRTPRATLEAATAKAQQHILLHATLP